MSDPKANPTVEELERPHHPYSPSSLQMREACPLWHSTGEAGEAAARGTLQHLVTETGEDHADLSDEEIAAAVECMDFADMLKAEMEAQAIQLEATPPPSFKGSAEEWAQRIVDNVKMKTVVYDEIEPYLPIDDRQMKNIPFFDWKTGGTNLINFEATTAGYADRILKAGNHAKVLDWKFGRWPVEEADNNTQGIAYVVGVFKKFPDVDSVELIFKLPHQKDITRHTFYRHQLDELYLRIVAIVERAIQNAHQEDYSKATPNVPACIFCARRGNCEKLHEIVLNVGHKFYPAKIPSDISVSVLKNPADFANGMRIAQIVTAWAEGYKRQGTQQVLQGAVEIPEGYVIAEYSKRKITDAEAYKESTKGFLTRKEYNATLKPGLTAVEEVIKGKAARGQKSKRVNEFLEKQKGVEKTVAAPYLKAIPAKKTVTNNDDQKTKI
jgi:hypothetical protein